MNQDFLKTVDKESALIRLTALWAMNEAALGGLLHLFRTPFSGLILASVAVILISLIAYIAEHPGREILKALIIVLIIKLTLSPHSPITAYIAVSFQGLLGALLYSFLPFRVSAIILGLLGLVESVFQKLLTLTLLFGMPLWESLDIFVEHVLKRLGYSAGNVEGQGSFWIVSSYVLVYAITGIVVGILIGNLPKRINQVLPSLEVPDISISAIGQSSKKKKVFWKTKKFRFFVIILTLLAIIYFSVPQAKEILHPLYLFFRVVVILLLWFLIVSPLLLKLLHTFLKKKESTYSKDVQKAMSLLPAFKALMVQAWKDVASYSGLKRIRQFIVVSLSYCLLYKDE